MSMVETKLKQWGNSVGVIIPKEIIKHENLHAGDTVKIDIIPNRKIDGFGALKGLPPFKEEKESHEDLW